MKHKINILSHSSERIRRLIEAKTPCLTENERKVVFDTAIKRGQKLFGFEASSNLKGLVPQAELSNDSFDLAHDVPVTVSPAAQLAAQSAAQSAAQLAAQPAAQPAVAAFRSLNDSDVSEYVEPVARPFRWGSMS